MESKMIELNNKENKNDMNDMNSEIFIIDQQKQEHHDYCDNDIYVEKSPVKYILFCAQEANFQTRSMLIPYDLIMKCEQRVRDLKILRDNTKKNIKFEHKGKEYIVDQLLIQNVTWKKHPDFPSANNMGIPDENPFRKIIYEFIGYADRMEEGHVFHLYDTEWTKEIICNIVGINGFNHIINYCNFRGMKIYEKMEIEIVEGFLVLESNDGKLYKPPVDTVQEMFDKYYPSRESGIFDQTSNSEM